MKTLLLLFCLIALANADSCEEKLGQLFECVGEAAPEGKGGASSGEEEKAEQLNECFESAGCKTPSQVKDCLLDGVDFSPIQTCLEGKDLGDIPVPDVDHFKMVAQMGGGEDMVKKFISAITQFKSKRNSLPPPMLQMIQGKIQTVVGEKVQSTCAEAENPKEATASVLSCASEILDIQLLPTDSAPNGPPFSLPAGGNPPFPPFGGKNKMPDLFGENGCQKGRKFCLPPAVKKVLRCVKETMGDEDNECKQKIGRLAGAICCCGKQVDMKAKLIGAAQTCGIKDDEIVGKMSDKVEGMICKKFGSAFPC